MTIKRENTWFAVKKGQSRCPQQILGPSLRVDEGLDDEHHPEQDDDGEPAFDASTNR